MGGVWDSGLCTSEKRCLDNAVWLPLCNSWLRACQRGGGTASPNFLELLHTHTRYEKSNPILHGNLSIGEKFYGSTTAPTLAKISVTLTGMLTHDLCAVANLRLKCLRAKSQIPVDKITSDIFSLACTLYSLS